MAATTDQEELTTVEVLLSEDDSSTHSLLSRGGSGYESLYGSSFGSHFSLTDGTGVYISNLALTVILSLMVAVTIILVSFIITLTVMVSACEKKHHSSLNSRIDSYCLSYQLNMELNNIHKLAVPLTCLPQISGYIHGGQYLKDFEAVVGEARTYLEGLVADQAENSSVLLDIDETALSNFLSSRRRIETYVDSLSAATWTDNSELLPLAPMLDLYLELSATKWNIIFLSERPVSAFNVTANNLIAAGYQSWAQLILRSDEEAGMTVEEYKSRKRAQLEEQGYQMKAVMGDQWSDLSGLAIGSRSFKLPNPVYKIL